MAMASMPPLRMGPPPRSFAADAHACIMVRALTADRMQGCGAMRLRPTASSLDIVIPTKTSVPPCSELSRCGLATLERGARPERRPTLTAPARDGVRTVRVGAKKRESKSNQETGMKEKRKCREFTG